MSCAICLDTLKAPTAYPCGHVFCYECIAQTVQRLSPMSTTSCPTCRASFPLMSINTALVPKHLRPFFLAPFRRLYLDEQTPSTSTPPSPSPSKQQQAALASLKSENASLQQSCDAWRRRAETHAATVLGLAAVMRMARAKLRAEHESLRQREEDLKRREAAFDRLSSRLSLSELGPPPSQIPTSPPKRARIDSDDVSAPPASKKKKLWVEEDTEPLSTVSLFSHRGEAKCTSFPSRLPVPPTSVTAV